MTLAPERSATRPGGSTRLHVTSDAPRPPRPELKKSGRPNPAAHLSPEDIEAIGHELDALPVIGEEHVVVGEGRGQDGRKTFTAATLYDADGRVVATAEHVWIAVDPALFGGRVPG